MALTTVLNHTSWEEIQEIVQNVLKNRKLEFQIETVLAIIKSEFIRKGISPEVMECTYFRILFLNTLDYFVEKGFLYHLVETYVPTDYMILHDYDTKSAHLFYLLANPTQKNIYQDVDMKRKVGVLSRRDFLLTGGFSQNKELITPSIPFEEIAYLYHSFLQEGANRELAIKHVLNYYQVQPLSVQEYLGNVVAINEKKHKKVLKKD